MVPYERKNLKFARENRKVRHATRHEGLLWHTYLKKCEVNFTRLYRIGNYILDFYAPSIRLAIEIDGGQHYDDAALLYDEKRIAFPNTKGIAVLRFTDSDIEKDLHGSTLKIEEEINRIMHQKP